MAKTQTNAKTNKKTVANNEFTKALRKEENAEARKMLDSFYYFLQRMRGIYSYVRLDYNASPEQKAMQHMGADLLIEKRKHEYMFLEEKVTFKDALFFEMEMYSYSQKRYVDGWLTSKYKKTDKLIYYIHDVGIYTFNFREIQQYVTENRELFKPVLSKDKKPNKLVVLTREQIEKAPHVFVDWEQVQYMSDTYDRENGLID